MADVQPQDLERYIDVKDALNRICGNVKIYKTLLGTFKRSLKYDQLREEAEAGDFEKAANTAHSIKGIVANLSMKAAYEKVTDVESQFKRGELNRDDLEELGVILQKTLECVDYLCNTL